MRLLWNPGVLHLGSTLSFICCTILDIERVKSISIETLPSELRKTVEIDTERRMSSTANSLLPVVKAVTVVKRNNVIGLQAGCFPKP